MQSVPLIAGLALFALATSAHGLSLVGSNFDQVEQLSQLGASVTQVGGDDPGGLLQQAGDFIGAPGADTGVSVTLPEWLPASSYTRQKNGNSAKAGNSFDLLLGDPTDVTLTLLGEGGPDAGPGDGSFEFSGNARVDLLFGAVVAPDDPLPDLFLVTGAPSDGKVRVTLLNASGGILKPRVTVTTAAGAVGSAVGGILLDVPNGVVYSGVRLDNVKSGTVELDAVYARVQMPEPHSAALLGGALIALAVARRRQLAL